MSCEDYCEEDKVCLRASPNRVVSCEGCSGDCDLKMAYLEEVQK